jgi:hypothetical protein
LIEWKIHQLRWGQVGKFKTCLPIGKMEKPVRPAVAIPSFSSIQPFILQATKLHSTYGLRGDTHHTKFLFGYLTYTSTGYYS